MDSHTSSTDLISIQYNVIRFCTNLARICIQKRKILFHRHGKRMMHGSKAVLLFAPLKKREFCYPHKTILVLIQKLHLFCKLHTESAKHIINYFVLISGKKKQVSRLSFHRLNKSVHLFFLHEFGKRGLS